MTNYPDMIRNVAVVGHLHHGKTSLVDMLVYETHKITWDADSSVFHAFYTFISLLLKQIMLDSLHGRTQTF